MSATLTRPMTADELLAMPPDLTCDQRRAFLQALKESRLALRTNPTGLQSDHVILRKICLTDRAWYGGSGGGSRNDDSTLLMRLFQRLPI